MHKPTMASPMLDQFIIDHAHVLVAEADYLEKKQHAKAVNQSHTCGRDGCANAELAMADALEAKAAYLRLQAQARLTWHDRMTEYELPETGFDVLMLTELVKLVGARRAKQVQRLVTQQLIEEASQHVLSDLIGSLFGNAVVVTEKDEGNSTGSDDALSRFVTKMQRNNPHLS